MSNVDFKTGDIFEEPVEAIVNTVNCDGFMGKGIALEFKRRWRDNFEAYKKECETERLRPGRMFIFDMNRVRVQDNMLDGNRHRYLINFPTKHHWRSKSKIKYVDDGLDDLIQHVKKLPIKSVALPALGCGNGGLDWFEVRPLIEKRLMELPSVRFVVFTPDSKYARIRQRG